MNNNIRTYRIYVTAVVQGDALLRARKNNRGQLALISLLIIGAITLMAALSASFTGMSDRLQGFRESQTQGATAVAEGCLDDTLQRLKSNPSLEEGKIDLGTNGVCRVSVFSMNASDKTLYITGQVGSSIRKLEVRVNQLGTSFNITKYDQVSTSAWWQTNWVGGANTSFASHYIGNQNDWTAYESKDLSPSIDAVNSGADLQLTQTSAFNWLQTDTSAPATCSGSTCTGFNAVGSSNANTQVTNVSGGEVKLATIFDGGTGASGAFSTASYNCPTGVEAGCVTGIIGAAPSFTINTSSVTNTTPATSPYRDTNFALNQVVYNFTDFTIATSGHTVTVTGTYPLVIKATGDVTIVGTLNLNGGTGGSSAGSGSAGSSAGGNGGAPGNGATGTFGGTGAGTGGGGGGGVNTSTRGSGGGGGGYAAVGTDGIINLDGTVNGGAGGCLYSSACSVSDATLSTFVGGSGGGGGGRGYNGTNSTGGGGGGGAVKISAKGTITVSGSITAKGGDGGSGVGANTSGGGGGSGGAIWLQGGTITNSGTVTVARGDGGLAGQTNPKGDGGAGANGRIRMDYGTATLGTPGVNVIPSVGYTRTSVYASFGTYTSAVYDTGQNSDFTTVSWNQTVSDPITSIKMKIATSNCVNGKTNPSACDDAGTWTYYGPAGTTAAGDNYTCTTASCSTAIPSFYDGSRYVRYQVMMTGDGTVTPTLENVTIGIAGYLLGGPYALTSSAYNTNNPQNMIKKIQWLENLPSTSTDVQIQIRTAADVAGAPGAWSPWCGPDNGVAGSCNSATYFTDPYGVGVLEPIDDTQKDGLSDQWLQYKVFLSTTNEGFTPTLSAIRIEYEP